nr:MAG TPA: Stage V sporulation protein AA [Bacteriophage sp.]
MYIQLKQKVSVHRGHNLSLVGEHYRTLVWCG